jgi:hypothetical protein
MMVDAIVAGEGEQPHLWPDARSLTVWTAIHWFTVTVMPVAFGRWGVAVCRDEGPRQEQPLELVARLRTEPEARVERCCSCRTS